jgi:hypothetical protein
MRRVVISLAIACLAPLSGCGQGHRAAEPVVTGTIEGGTLWKKPAISPDNEGFSPEKGSRLEVYDQFIIVTTPNGLSHVRPHGSYSDLAFRKIR